MLPDVTFGNTRNLMNLRELILQVNDTPLEPIEIREWGCTVYIKALTGTQRNQLLKDIQKKTGSMYGYAMASSLCDQDGKQLFTIEDIDALNEKNGKVLERLASYIVKLNAIFGEAIDEAKKD